MGLYWRWDQGRTAYFSVDALSQAVRVLVSFDGKNPDDVKAPLRERITKATGLPFAPNSQAYLSIFRNYARIFEASQLATRIDGKLVVTDIGKKLSIPGELSSDEYLMHFARSCPMPNPAFDDYDGNVSCYPAVAVIRLLMAHEEFTADGLSEADVISVLAGNHLHGSEAPTTFAALPRTGRVPEGDEERQVREFLRFLAQFSFLHFSQSRLWYNGPERGSAEWDALWTALEPRVLSLPTDAAEAILALGSISDAPELRLSVVERDPAEQFFIEGSRSQRTHVMLERNKRLRKQFLDGAERPIACDVCTIAPDEKYPWTKDLVELHHLLPLSSAIRVGSSSTLLTDIVPVCPTCHRAVHTFYSRWLKKEGKKDFSSKEEAHDVYDSVKKLVA
jgi:hypothetical protein